RPFRGACDSGTRCQPPAPMSFRNERRGLGAGIVAQPQHVETAEADAKRRSARSDGYDEHRGRRQRGDGPNVVPEGPVDQIARPDRRSRGARGIGGRKLVVQRHVEDHGDDEHPKHIEDAAANHRNGARLLPSQPAEHDQHGAGQRGADKDRHERRAQDIDTDRVHRRDAGGLIDPAERGHDERREREIEP
ncbi:hypothetical protein chiPu_0032633, partial [Chiloscyllium punctatum]|nr:hypothetical protein [Chiloscyllium punctatum]